MFRNLSIIGLTAALSCSRAFCETPNALQEANALAAEHDLGAAQQVLGEYLKEHPDDPRALRQLADAKFNWKGESKEAYELLQKAYRIDPQASQLPELELARLYGKVGDYREAELWADYAVKNGADERSAVLALAESGLERWNRKVTFQQTERLQKLDPASIDALVIRGQFELRSADYKAAQEYFVMAVARAPGDFRVRNGIALALCEQDDDSIKMHALRYSEANFKKHPGVAQAAITQGRVLYRLGRIDEADKAIHGIVASGSGVTSCEAYYIACIDAACGRKEEACEIVRHQLNDNLTFPIDEREPPGDMKNEMVALLPKLYPDPKREPLKQRDTVIVIRRRTYPLFDGHYLACFCGGTRLKVVSESSDGKLVRIQDQNGVLLEIPRKDVARVESQGK